MNATLVLSFSVWVTKQHRLLCRSQSADGARSRCATETFVDTFRWRSVPELPQQSWLLTADLWLFSYICTSGSEVNIIAISLCFSRFLTHTFMPVSAGTRKMVPHWVWNAFTDVKIKFLKAANAFIRRRDESVVTEAEFHLASWWSFACLFFFLERVNTFITWYNAFFRFNL